MKSVVRSALLALMFLVGCATGGVASQLASSASAQPTQPPPGAARWAYFCFQDDRADSIRDKANRAGAEGWELVASALSGGAPASSPIWCFKRSY